MLYEVITVSSCQKGSGEGGKATITGTVMIHEYNFNFTVKRAVYPGADVDVYIIYDGDEEVFYGDKVSTSHNGKYEFKYLREGDYTIFAYTKDPSIDYNNSSQKLPVFRKVSITSSSQVATLDTIIVLK